MRLGAPLVREGAGGAPARPVDVLEWYVEGGCGFDRAGVGGMWAEDRVSVGGVPDGAWCESAASVGRAPWGC